MDELSSRLHQFARDNLLAVLWFAFGLILLASGLIAYFGVLDRGSDIIYEASSKGDTDDVNRAG